LYNLKNDPRERDNLAGLPEYQPVEEEMRQRLTAWFARYVDPIRDGVLTTTAGGGQIGLCGWSDGEQDAFLDLFT